MDHEHGLLGWLDGPRLVVGAFAFFLCGLTVLGILLWSDQREQVRRIDALTAEQVREQRVAYEQAVARCFASANLSPSLERVLVALEALPTTVEGRQAIRDFRQLNRLNSTTLRECRQLADSLRVPIPRGVR